MIYNPTMLDWFNIDCTVVLQKAGFDTSSKYKIHASSTRLEIQINYKIKPHDNSQKTIETGHNDSPTSIDL